jgi:uncharacterized membrane protein YqgA involved in biofilm formation
MAGLGTIINTTAIITGGIAGSLLKSGIPERFKETITQALGLSIIIIGISGTLQGIYIFTAAGKIDRIYIMLMILSLVTGAVIGELLKIEEMLEVLGNFIQNRFAKDKSSFSEGFISASLLYCVGAMAIVGSLEDGLTGNTSTLLAKSVLDGVLSVMFGATLGIGVAFSSISVFLYQGSITVLAGYIKPWLTESVISQTSLVGSVLITAIGLNILGIKRIRVGNLLPAVFIPLLYYLAREVL